MGPFLTITVLESSWWERGGWRWVRGKSEDSSRGLGQGVSGHGFSCTFMCLSPHHEDSDHFILGLDTKHSMHLATIRVSEIAIVLEIQTPFFPFPNST